MEFLLSADAAKIIGVVPATVRWLERTGKLTATRTASGVRLFSRVEVERIARERERRRVTVMRRRAERAS